MSEKLTLREKLHIGEKRPDGERPPMNKKVKKAIIAVVCTVAVCGAVWGGLTIARNAQRGDVNVYAVGDCAMTDYWGDNSNTGGMVTTDKLQKIYISQSQTVTKVWVKEGDEVKKGDPLVSYDSTLTQASVERARIQYDRQVENLSTAKSDLELLKKAQSKETLEAERNGYQKQRDDIIKKIYDDKGLDEPITHTHILPSTDPNVIPNGTEKTPYYYQWISKTPLTQADLIGMFTSNGKSGDDPLYVVLVYRTDDKVGGLVERCWGLKLTAITETESTEPAPGVTVTDPNEPSTPTTKKPIVSVSMEPADLADYQDGALDYGDKKEEIAKLDKKIAQIDELLAASMERADLNKAILDKMQEIKELEVNNKLAKLDLDKKLRELGDGNVYAEFSGTVKAVRDATEAYNNSEAVVELSGGGGYYVSGTLSEMDLGSVKVGDTVQISSWRTGAFCEGPIVSIDDYPTNNGNNWGDGNSNVSYYPFKVFVTEDANLEPNDYVDIQYQKVSTQQQTGSSLYLESMFIREDNGKSYVMVRNEDGRLEQRWVQTGRDLWGSYTQIRGGLTIDDYVAFPYGRDVVEGAHTQEATVDQLYNYGV